ncbi:MAG: hypothetical protein H7A01_08940 [Hahellaceae bacterium]|nr:hypothetical protein [Hahellaceae bacterium]MCP5211402.1 hypothetical protein [Hahellaceae bacterium]
MQLLTCPMLKVRDLTPDCDTSPTPTYSDKTLSHFTYDERWRNTMKLSTGKVLFTLTNAYDNALMKDLESYFNDMYFAN